MGNNLQRICREAVNADLSLYLLFLGTSPLTVIPTTGYGKELIGKAQGRKDEQEARFELISVGNIFGEFSYNVKCKEVCFWVKHLRLLESLG